MHPLVKKLAHALLPERIFVTIQSIRSRNYQQRLHREWGVDRSNAALIAKYGTTIVSGPFRGMKYPEKSLLAHHSVPIVFGSYELELHPVIEEVVTKTYDKIIDIGCAEGYYAVGLATRNPAPVYAFDCEPRERGLCRQMALLNGVADRVHVESWCTGDKLKALATGRSLIVSDCEGAEVNIFAPEIIKGLNQCDLIIELHFDARDTLLERFKATHKAQLLSFDARNPGEVPDEWKRTAREFRDQPQQWLYLTPK